MDFTESMRLAIQEAEASLRDGNNGFGAVIVKNGNIIASAHDEEESLHDPTSHAELNVIREASRILGANLHGCTLVSTHEPCPMCSFAIVWAGIERIAYGYSIKDAIAQGRRRIDYSCMEAFSKASAHIEIHEGIFQKECALLYRKDLRNEIKRLRGADDRHLDMLNDDSIQRRLQWYWENKDDFDFLGENPLESSYRLLLNRLKITPEDAPIVEKTESIIIFHSKNYCPTLEACRILRLDTRYVCKRINEISMDKLIRQIDDRLRFSRNYDRLRPQSDYCEECISMEQRNLDTASQHKRE